MEVLNEFLIQEAMIVIPVLWIMGMVIKGTPGIKDWLIPYILLFFGIFFAIGIIGLSFEAMAQGVLVTGLAVFGHQLFIQAVKGEEH